MNQHRHRALTLPKLTSQQERFVAGYLVRFDAKAAACTAGYSQKHAASIGCNLLKLPHVAAAIKAGMDARAKRTEITQDRVLREIARLAFSDIRTVFDEQGQLREVTDLNDDEAAAIQSIEVVARPGTDAKGAAGLEYVHKVRLVEKTAPLTLLCRHLGLLNDKIDLTACLHTVYETAPDAELIARLEVLLAKDKPRSIIEVQGTGSGLALDRAK